MPKTGTFSHISLSVSDYDNGKKYYDFLLADLLGYKKVMEHPYYTMWTLPSGECVCISPGNKTLHQKQNPGLHHLAFNVGTHEEIDHFYEKIIKFHGENKGLTGCTILDKPALYPQYGEGYYAVFFTDPDNIKLELAYTPNYH
ncbi:MAG: Glyoxalase/Bleomycin resistance protein/Dihydroxybiphenyl dioxygenase [Linnemannia gamsii]|nr:MAG: Glyoxalase/Bleomycin resistance protein/Dihydroxybiphenyl dioxygenase [Linnemannia gamsii]